MYCFRVMVVRFLYISMHLPSPLVRSPSSPPQQIRKRMCYILHYCRPVKESRPCLSSFFKSYYTAWIMKPPCWGELWATSAVIPWQGVCSFILFSDNDKAKITLYQSMLKQNVYWQYYGEHDEGTIWFNSRISFICHVFVNILGIWLLSNCARCTYTDRQAVNSRLQETGQINITTIYK